MNNLVLGCIAAVVGYGAWVGNNSFTIFIIAGIYFLTKLLQLQKVGLFWQDKQIASEDKWKLVSTWISD